MLCGSSSCSEACLFFSDDLLCLWLQSVQYDLQHDFVWVTDEADCLVVLALLQLASLWKCEDWVQGVGHSPVCQILLQIVVRGVITSSPPAWTSSAGMLLTPVDFPSFNDPPKGGRGCLMSPPCLESQGCHLIPLFYLLSCSSA